MDGKIALFCKFWFEGRRCDLQMCAMCDSQNAFGEKVRWGKNLNFWVGLSVGNFHFQSVFVLSSCSEMSVVSLSFPACC